MSTKSKQINDLPTHLVAGRVKTPDSVRQAPEASGKAGGDMTAGEPSAGQPRQALLEQLDLMGDIRALQALQLMNSFTSVAAITLFKRIRESRQINNLPFRLPNGEVTAFHSIRAACRVLFGRTYESMLDAEADFDLLGEQAYEHTKRLGLSRAVLRTAAALPGPKFDQVRALITEGGTKSEVKSLIEGLAADLADQQAALREEREERKAEAAISAAKSAQIDQLKARIARIRSESPDERAAGLMKEATKHAHDAVGLVRGHLREAVKLLTEHGAQHGDGPAPHAIFLAGLVGQVQAELTRLRAEYALPDISAAADQPEWAAAEWAAPARPRDQAAEG